MTGAIHCHCLLHTAYYIFQRMSQLAFFVNSDACSGCKTCQVACKDRHDLPAGLHWRRVYEVTSGAWQKSGDAWTHTVAAYHLSVACHHCADPVCGKQCSVDAIWKRPDGIVLIDQTRCVKCNKCRDRLPVRSHPLRGVDQRRQQVRLLRGRSRRRAAARLRGRLPESRARLRAARRPEASVRAGRSHLPLGGSGRQPARHRAQAAPARGARSGPRAGGGELGGAVETGTMVWGTEN